MEQIGCPERSVKSYRNRPPKFQEEGKPQINLAEAEAWNLISQLTVTLSLSHQEKCGVKLQ
jgi:phosphopantetheinyl transferase (holo-ACP synthase)